MTEMQGSRKDLGIFIGDWGKLHSAWYFSLLYLTFNFIKPRLSKLLSKVKFQYGLRFFKRYILQCWQTQISTYLLSTPPRERGELRSSSCLLGTRQLQLRTYLPGCARTCSVASLSAVDHPSHRLPNWRTLWRHPWIGMAVLKLSRQTTGQSMVLDDSGDHDCSGCICWNLVRAARSIGIRAKKCTCGSTQSIGQGALSILRDE